MSNYNLHLNRYLNRILSTLDHLFLKVPTNNVHATNKKKAIISKPQHSIVHGEGGLLSIYLSILRSVFSYACASGRAIVSHPYTCHILENVVVE